MLHGCEPMTAKLYLREDGRISLTSLGQAFVNPRFP
jgi:hypothetical protein